jgi:hypothetical protein
VRAAKANPNASFFGGPVDPWFEQRPPIWIKRNFSQMGPVYAQVIVPAELDGRPIRTLVPVPFGANMATRRRCFESHAFDTSIGPKHARRLGGEDVALLRRLIRYGHQGVWVRDARLKHFIPRERLTRRYVWNWYVAYGRTLVRTGEIRADGSRILGAPAPALRRYLQSLSLVFLLEPLRNAVWFHHFCEAARMSGAIEEWRVVSAECAHPHLALASCGEDRDIPITAQGREGAVPLTLSNRGSRCG